MMNLFKFLFLLMIFILLNKQMLYKMSYFF